MSDSAAPDDMSVLTEDGTTSSESSSLASSSNETKSLGKKPKFEMELVEPDRTVWTDDNIALELGDFVLFKQSHPTVETFFGLFCKRTQMFLVVGDIINKNQVFVTATVVDSKKYPRSTVNVFLSLFVIQDAEESDSSTEVTAKDEFLYESIKDVMFTSDCWFNRNIPRYKLTFQSIANQLPAFKTHIDNIDINSILRRVFILSDRDLMSAESDEEENRLLADCDKLVVEKEVSSHEKQENNDEGGGTSAEPQNRTSSPAPADQKSKRRSASKSKSAQSSDEVPSKPRSSRRAAAGKPIARYADEQKIPAAKKKVVEPPAETKKADKPAPVGKKNHLPAVSGGSKKKQPEVFNVDDEAYEDYQQYGAPWTPIENVDSRYDPHNGRERRLSSGKPQADVEAVLRDQLAHNQRLLVEALQNKLNEKEEALQSLSRAGSLQSQQSAPAPPVRSFTNRNENKRRSNKGGAAPPRSRSESPPNEDSFRNMFGGFPAAFSAGPHHPQQPAGGMMYPHHHHHQPPLQVPFGYYPPPLPPSSGPVLDPNFAMLLNNANQAFYIASMNQKR